MLKLETALAILKLNDCMLGDEGAVGVLLGAPSNEDCMHPITPPAGLLENKTLATLELARNSIGDRAAKAMCDLLSQNNTLEGLSLARNLLGAASVEALGEGLCLNGTLKWLSLAGNRLGPDGAHLLCMGACC